MAVSLNPRTTGVTTEAAGNRVAVSWGGLSLFAMASLFIPSCHEDTPLHLERSAASDSHKVGFIPAQLMLSLQTPCIASEDDLEGDRHGLVLRREGTLEHE